MGITRGIREPFTSSPLQIDGLSKRFGSLLAVDQISLRVESRECLGLLGPNGAGKSTLLRSIAGRVLPDGGTVSIFGAAAGSAEARSALGWIPQELALYARLTCRENLISFGRYQGLKGAELLNSVAWCLEWAALQDRAGEPVKNLSGGMKRRLNMAAGLIHRPRLVLMDEPTTGVDPQSRNRIFEMIETLRREGMAIIYTTHYMEEAERLCDRIAIVDHGHVIAEGRHEELVQRVFDSNSEVLVHLSGVGAQEWVAQRGGRTVGEASQFTVGHATEVAGLLTAIAEAGLELVDISVRRPNLESVFLHLTGRGLRD